MTLPPDPTPPDPAAPETFPDLLIYGLGRSGRGVARFLGREGRRAAWWDRAPGPEDLALADSLGFPRADLSRPYRTVVAAPGVPIDHPDLEALRARGAEIVGEAELARRARPDLVIVGVTGTAGKGGTSSLAQQLLAALGVDARLGGNFDPPLLDVIDGAEVAVAELSSFQLERVVDFRPDVAVITNLGVDHLDRHGTLEAYHAAKRNIARAQTEDDVLILPPGVEAPTRAGVRRFDPARLALADGTEVLAVGELPEGHHPANAAAALLAAEAALARLGRTAPPEAWRAAFARTAPVPGRFETVARRGGLVFVDDSIATRTLAVLAALERARPPIVWLVGGRDKGAELAPLAAAARGRVAHVVAFGEDGAKFAAALRLPATVVPPGEGEAAMRAAVEAAVAALGGADASGTVLLAPIGTSFDAFPDYKARGAAFKRAALAFLGETAGAGVTP